MAVTDFVAASKPLKEALKSANLLKSLKFNTLICGEPGTGRHTLARLMMPNTPIISADAPSVYDAIEKNQQLIIDKLERLDSLSKLTQIVQKYGTQIIGIGDMGAQGEAISLFSVKIVLPPLHDRPEDIPPLAEKFRREVLHAFGEEEETFKVDLSKVDLSRNALSLRKSIYIQYLSEKVDSEQLLDLIENFLSKQMDGEENLYRKFLYLYEVPLIRAGVKKYRSQLKMSHAFGLNRNTLRKKIQEWCEFLTCVKEESQNTK